MSVSQDFLNFVLEQMQSLPALRSKRMFGGVGLYSDEVFFAILAEDSLYLKADDGNRQLFVDAGSERFQFVMKGKQRSMDYWLVPAEVLEDAEALAQWTRSAIAAGLRSK